MSWTFAAETIKRKKNLLCFHHRLPRRISLKHHYCEIWHRSLIMIWSRTMPMDWSHYAHTRPCAVTHMRINRGCLLRLSEDKRPEKKNNKKKKLPWDRKGLKISEIWGWLCCEGGHSAPCPTALTSAAPRGWSCCQGTHWTCDELPLRLRPGKESTLKACSARRNTACM